MRLFYITGLMAATMLTPAAASAAEIAPTLNNGTTGGKLSVSTDLNGSVALQNNRRSERRANRQGNRANRGTNRSNNNTNRQNRSNNNGAAQKIVTIAVKPEWPALRQRAAPIEIQGAPIVSRPVNEHSAVKIRTETAIIVTLRVYATRRALRATTIIAPIVKVAAIKETSTAASIAVRTAITGIIAPIVTTVTGIAATTPVGPPNGTHAAGTAVGGTTTATTGGLTGTLTAAITT